MEEWYLSFDFSGSSQQKQSRPAGFGTVGLLDKNSSCAEGFARLGTSNLQSNYPMTDYLIFKSIDVFYIFN